MKIERIDGIIILEPHGAVYEYNDVAHLELMQLVYEVVLLDTRQELGVIADLSEVTFMNSSGLGQLIHAYLSMRTRGGRFALCAVPPRIMTLIKLVRLETVFKIFDTRAQALTEMTALPTP